MQIKIKKDQKEMFDRMLASGDFSQAMAVVLGFMTQFASGLFTAHDEFIEAFKEGNSRRDQLETFLRENQYNTIELSLVRVDNESLMSILKGEQEDMNLIIRFSPLTDRKTNKTIRYFEFSLFRDGTVGCGSAVSVRNPG